MYNTNIYRYLQDTQYQNVIIIYKFIIKYDFKVIYT